MAARTANRTRRWCCSSSSSLSSPAWPSSRPLPRSGPGIASSRGPLRSSKECQGVSNFAIPGRQKENTELGDDRLCFGFGGWRGGWHSHPSVLVRSNERFGRSRSTLETSFSSVPLARLEVEAFAPDVPSSRWTRSAVARCFLQMRLAVGCSDGDSIFPPAPWSFMSSTSSPRSTLSVATAPVAVFPCCCW